VAAAFGLAACRAPVQGPVAADLVALFPSAETMTEAERIDFGTDEAAPHLLEGWGLPESGDGQKYRWALGSRARLRFFLTEPRALTLQARCWSAPLPSGEEQALDVLINGRPQQHARIGASGSLRMTVPPEALAGGDNLLELRFAHATSGLDGDPRRLAVAWDYLEIGPPSPGSPPSVVQSPPTLSLPAGSGVRYYLELPPGTVLSWDALRAVGTAKGTHVVLRARAVKGSGVRESTVRTGSAGAWTVTDASLSGLIELSIAAAAQAKGAAGGVELLGPKVHEPAAAPAPAAAPRVESTPRAKNVILYLVDTLRRDHLDLYGYDRPTSPALDRFAQEALVFDDARSNTSWTRPSVATILTGLAPAAHGVVDQRHVLPNSTPYLPEILQRSGFATAAVNTNVNVAAKFGFARGFDDYHYLDWDSSSFAVTAPAAKLVDTAISWLERRPREKRFLLYAHASDPHAPYAPPAPYRQRFDRLGESGLNEQQRKQRGLHELDKKGRGIIDDLEAGTLAPTDSTAERLIDLYDAEIAYGDAEFGRLVEWLKRNGLYDNTLIVFTADHGEEFGEHQRWGHGMTLFDEQLRVPLVVKPPTGGGAPQRIADRVQHLDLLPTVLAQLGLQPLPARQGRDLGPLMRGEHDGREVPAVGHLDLDGRRLDSVSWGSRKLVRYLRFDRLRGPEETFDLAADPGETENLVGLDPVGDGYLRALLRHSANAAGRPEVPAVELDEETAARLRTLGYLK
jgi:arylsulfatase A-like enzyme